MTAERYARNALRAAGGNKVKATNELVRLRGAAAAAENKQLVDIITVAIGILDGAIAEAVPPSVAAPARRSPTHERTDSRAIMAVPKMSITQFLDSREQMPAGGSAFRYLAEALANLRVSGGHVLMEFVYQSLTARAVTEDEAGELISEMRRMVADNRAVLAIVDNTISAGECVFPAIWRLDHLKPPVSDVLSVISRIPEITAMCHVDARLQIHSGSWADAVIAISRLFRFASLLELSWSDFGLASYGYEASMHGYRACTEMAFRRGVDIEAVLRA